MSENSNEFMIDFIPKTDQTFIAPNENFNTFSHNFCNIFGQKPTKSGPRDGSDEKKASPEGAQRKRKIPSDETFVDFVVQTHKEDGIVCTLDENERQIYYCYYCHQYITDADLIQSHIHTSNHMTCILNGISFDRGLDKEFVLSLKRPPDIKKLIRKELIRLPFHLKHYYFRNNIRIMDVQPPNAYFCKSCDETVAEFNLIDAHLSTDKHIASKQKPTLMQLIENSDNPVLKIGLQFINEEKIADSSCMVYECQLCNCLDCNTDKMFAHIKSLEHRINLVEQYDYDPTDLNEEEIDDLVKQVHDKHGSGVMTVGAKSSKSSKKVKFNDDLVSETSGLAVSPAPQVTESSAQTVDKSMSRVVRPPTNTEFLKRDRFLSEFKEDKIIETFESDGREVYYCCYCDEYFNSRLSMERHIGEQTHKKYQPNEKNSSKGLNKKFSMRVLTAKPTDETDDSNCLERMPLTLKHFYFKRGIKHLTGDRFYCRLCQTTIDSFDEIENHLRFSESHIRIEERPTKFNDLLFQTSQPIIGLKFIKQLTEDNSQQIRYKCTLCDCVHEFCQMFVHLNCFSHQYKVLRKISPNNKIFKDVKEKEVSFKSSELIKKEISYIEEEVGCGFVSLSPDTRTEAKSNTTKDKPPKSKDQSLSPASPVIRKECTLDSPIIDRQSLEKSPLTEEQLLSSLSKLFAVKAESEDDMPALVTIIEALKDSLYAYYKPFAEKPSLTALSQAVQRPIDSDEHQSNNYDNGHESDES